MHVILYAYCIVTEYQKIAKKELNYFYKHLVAESTIKELNLVPKARNWQPCFQPSLCRCRVCCCRRRRKPKHKKTFIKPAKFLKFVIQIFWPRFLILFHIGSFKCAYNSTSIHHGAGRTALRPHACLPLAETNARHVRVQSVTVAGSGRSTVSYFLTEF